MSDPMLARHPRHRRPRGRAHRRSASCLAGARARGEAPAAPAPPRADRAAGAAAGRAAAEVERRRRRAGAGRRAPSRGRASRSSERAAPARPAGQDPRRVRGALGGITGRGQIDDETWDELEETLLLADVGVPTTTRDPRRTCRRAPRPSKAADADALLDAAAATSCVALLEPTATATLARRRRASRTSGCSSA